MSEYQSCLVIPSKRCSEQEQVGATINEGDAKIKGLTDESHKRASVSDDSRERHTHGLDALSVQRMQSHTASRCAQAHEDAGR